MSVSWKQAFMYTKWPQNDPKAIAKSTQNGLKSPSYVEIAAKNFPKWIQSGPKWFQSDPKLASYAKNDPKVTPKWP